MNVTPRTSAWPPILRLDVSTLADDASIIALRQGIVEPVAIPPADSVDWDTLKRRWSAIAVIVGKERRVRQAEELNAVLTQIRLLERGGSKTLLIREHLSVLRARYSRLLTLSTIAAAN